jgi:D-amino-acid dehydrogenase
MERHVVIIGAGVVGAISAIESLQTGLRVTIVDPEQVGGEQAASYGNAGWLSSHSVIPPAEPGIWKRVPGFILDPLGPLAIRWGYLPRAARRHALRRRPEPCELYLSMHLHCITPSHNVPALAT